jgi:hypothetical protein
VSQSRTRRRWPWAVAAAVLVFLLATWVLLLPSVQRRLVERFFPSGPGTSIAFDDLRVGLRDTEIRGLRLEWHGLKVAIDRVEARYRLIGPLLMRRARVERLRVSGLRVDIRSVERPPAGAPPAAGAAGEPFRFEGMRPFAQLPVRVLLSDVRIDAELIAPGPDGGTARLHALVTGSGVAPGSTGELRAEVGLRRENGDGVREMLQGTGSLQVHETGDGLLDIVRFRGEVQPADPSARLRAGLAAGASVDLTAADEAYGLTFSTAGTNARDVLSVKALRHAADGRVAGSWTALLDAGLVNPYLGDLAPPEFSLNGEGTFTLDLDALTAATQSRFRMSASHWERLDPRLARIGPLSFDLDLGADYARPRIAVRSVTARVAPVGASPVLEVGADQPFSVDPEARTIEPSQWGRPLAHLKLADVPVTWWSGAGSAAGTASGKRTGSAAGTGFAPFAGTLRGAVELTMDDARRVRVRSTEPVQAAGVRLHTAGARDLGPVSAQAGFDAAMSDETFAAKVAGCRVAFADGSALGFDGSFAMPRDGRFRAALEGRVAAHLAALGHVVPDVDSVGAGGRFTLDLSGGTLALHEADVDVKDGRGRVLVEGKLSTVRPLTVNLDGFAPRWNEFEPETLRLRLDGFPIAWVSRFLPQIRLASGALSGEFHATVPPDRSVHIAGAVPFEARDVDLAWGDLPVLAGARLQVSPVIVLKGDAVEADLGSIAFRDARGNRFDGDVRVRSAATRGALTRFEADFHALAPSLTDRIGNLGEFSVRAEGSFDGAAQSLRLDAASFDCRDKDGRSYLAGTSLHPFTVGLTPFAISPGEASPDLFRATFTPLAIERLFPQAFGLRLQGPMPSGEAVISAHEGGLLFHAPQPLTFGPVSVTRNDEPLLDEVQFSLLPEVAYTTTGIRSREIRVEITSGGRPIASIDTKGAFEIAGAHPERAIEATLKVSLPALIDQPVMRGLPRFDAGELSVSWQGAIAPRRRLDMRAALTGLARRDGLVAPDFEARAHLEEEAAGRFRIEAPLRIMTPQRTSDLTATGTLTVENGQNNLALSIESDRIVLEDVVRLASAFLPAEAGTAETKPGATTATGGDGNAGPPPGPPQRTLLARLSPEDGRPLWDVLHGRVPIHLRSVEFDRYAATDVRATLESTSRRLAVEEIDATVLGARLRGQAAATFDPAGAAPDGRAPGAVTAPYGVQATFEIPDVDLGRLFTQAFPDRKATLEGRFRLDATIHGLGADPVEAVLENEGEIRAVGSDAVFRGFVPEAKSASRLVRAVGALTFSKELRAVGRLVGNLQELRVHEARVHLQRDPRRGLILDAFDVRSEEIAVHGSGSIRRERTKPLLDREMRLDVDLAASGDAAIVFDGLGLLGDAAGAAGAADVRGMRRVTHTVSITGSLGAPDASDLWQTLDAAAERARGAFGVALRKAMSMAAPGKTP